ncbi:MAG: hypothetical protein AB198_00945 [Parcubacteria bacterium C7867-003]|nr:MAG: hypothetical protein AB198_00945 [Parcubacteria bacterium C7867-003]
METTITVVIRPSEEISKKILEVKKKTGVYYPNHEDSPPHITLYRCKLEQGAYNEVIRTLSEIKIYPTELTLSKLSFSEIPKRDYTFAYFDIVERDILQNIHETILNAVNPLRGDLVMNKDLERYKRGETTEEDFNLTKKYGFLYFMEKYNPHITIGTFPIGDMSKKNELVSELGELEGVKFKVDKIFVKYKTRTVPEENVVFESDTTEINLEKLDF